VAEEVVDAREGAVARVLARDPLVELDRRAEARGEIVARVFVAMVYLLCGSQRLARGIAGCRWRAIEEFASGVAPLVLFALLWLLADSVQPPSATSTRLR
jgi:hypothetical protein